ncbi:MAG: hypothetical protein ACRC2T_03275 [Thermoguttaceae bacterium]
MDGAKPVASYIYDGSGSAMQTTYNPPGVTLNYTNGGLDRFGRIVNHGWLKGPEALVHILHTYDFAGNRLTRFDAVKSDISELYSYDQVNQIKTLRRGELNEERDSVSQTTFAEAWDFDKTGNWTQFDKNGIIQARTANEANEITSINSNINAIQHDLNGNMKVLPGQKAKYDAWNRLVEVRDLQDVLISRCEYNGMNQRVKKIVGDVVTTHFFNENWQELEQMKGGNGGANGTGITLYIWGQRYIDDLVLREVGEEKLYSIADPNWNVVAICDEKEATQKSRSMVQL